MEVIIANHRDISFSVGQSKKDSAKFKKNVKFSNKDAMTIFKAELVRITKRSNSKEKRSVPFKDTAIRCPTLKELQEKEIFVS